MAENTQKYPTDRYKGYVAIDLGTTNSVVGYIDEYGQDINIPNRDGDMLTPSFIHFKKKGVKPKPKIEILAIGKKAKEAMETVKEGSDEFIMSSYKTKMGLPYPGNVIWEDSVPKNDPTYIPKKFLAEDCSEIVLRELRKSAETYLEENYSSGIINGAFITVPARFYDPKRAATKRAAENAGFTRVEILDEPTAAAFYYLYDENNPKFKDRTVMVYDLGGGTFDVSMVYMFATDDVRSKCTQGATAGNTNLGGDLIDKEIAEWLYGELGFRKDFHSLPIDQQDILIRLAEHAKIDISNNYYNSRNKKSRSVQSATINLDNLPKSLKKNLRPGQNTVTLTKSKCFELEKSYIMRTIYESNKMVANKSIEKDNENVDEEIYTVERLMEKKCIRVSDLDDVLLVGGSSRLPLVHEMMSEFLENKYREEHPEDATLEGFKFTMDYFDMTLVDPDKAVCYGARKYMKAMLDGDRDVYSSLVTAPIGIVLYDSDGAAEFVKVISQNQKVPMRRPLRLRTLVSNLHKGEPEFQLEVQQGCSTNVENNVTLGTIHVPLLSDKYINNPGFAKFAILLQVDDNKCVTVTVQDKTKGHDVSKRTFTETFERLSNNVQNGTQSNTQDIDIIDAYSTDTRDNTDNELNDNVDEDVNDDVIDNVNNNMNNDMNDLFGINSLNF